MITFVTMRCLTFLWLRPEAEKGPCLMEFALKEKKKQTRRVVLGGPCAVCLMWHGWEGKVKLLLYAIGMLSLHIVSHYCSHQI